MKSLLFIMSLFALLAFQVACDRNTDRATGTTDIQREEALESDDLRDTGTYDRSAPMETDDVQMEESIDQSGDVQREESFDSDVEVTE